MKDIREHGVRSAGADQTLLMIGVSERLVRRPAAGAEYGGLRVHPYNSLDIPAVGTPAGGKHGAVHSGDDWRKYLAQRWRAANVTAGLAALRDDHLCPGLPGGDCSLNSTDLANDNDPG